MINEKKCYRLFVGSDNLTKHLNAKLIKEITNKHFKGFNFQKSSGFWKGKEEKNAIIEIDDAEQDKINLLASELKTSLNQEAILIQQFNANIQFF